MKIIAMVAALLLAGCQGVSGSGSAVVRPAATGALPSPTPYVFDPGKVTYIYPAGTPAPEVVKPISCSSGVTQMRATARVIGDALVIKVTDQAGRSVACAWAHIVSGNYGIGGMTDGTGAITVLLSTLPRDDHFVDTVQLGSVSTAFEFRR